MANIEEIRAAMYEQKEDFVASVKSDISAMKGELAIELRAELNAFVHEEISKKSGPQSTHGAESFGGERPPR